MNTRFILKDLTGVVTEMCVCVTCWAAAVAVTFCLRHRGTAMFHSLSCRAWGDEAKVKYEHQRFCFLKLELPHPQAACNTKQLVLNLCSHTWLQEQGINPDMNTGTFMSSSWQRRYVAQKSAAPTSSVCSSPRRCKSLNHTGHRLKLLPNSTRHF